MKHLLAVATAFLLAQACSDDPKPAAKKAVKEKDSGDSEETTTEPDTTEPETTVEETTLPPATTAAPAGNGTFPPPPAASIVPPTDGGHQSPQDLAALKASYDACTAQGKSWIAVTGAGGDPSCGAPVAPQLCCARDNILKRYPGTAPALAERFKIFLDDGKMALYGCALEPDGRTRFLFARFDGSLTYRSTYAAEKASATVPDDPACVPPGFPSIPQ